MPSGKRPRTKIFYNHILAAARKVGQRNFVAIAKLAGVDRETVSYLWKHGWPKIPGALALKDVLEVDATIARAVRQKADPGEQVFTAQQVLSTALDGAQEDAKDAADMLAKIAKRAEEAEAKAKEMMAEAQRRLDEVEALARAKLDDTEKAAKAVLLGADMQAKQRLADLLTRAKVDAAETMADEANAAKFGRKAALGAAAVAALVLKDAQTIATQLRAAFGDLSKLKPVQAMRLAREMVRLVESAEKAVILALQAERLRLGQPTDIVGIESIDGGLEEKEIKLKAVQRALEKAKAKGMSVIQGGAPSGNPTPAAGQQ